MLFPYTFDFDLVLLIDYHFGYREKVKKCRKKVTWAFGFTFSEIVSEKVWPIKRKRHNIVLPLLIYHACGITKKILLWNYKKDCGITKKIQTRKRQLWIEKINIWFNFIQCEICLWLLADVFLFLRKKRLWSFSNRPAMFKALSGFDYYSHWFIRVMPFYRKFGFGPIECFRRNLGRLRLCWFRVRRWLRGSGFVGSGRLS